MASFNDLGPALVELRMARGKKAQEVAETAGITKSMLSSYENGHVEPTVATLEKVLDALEVGPTELGRAMRQVRLHRGEDSELPKGSMEFGPAERAAVADALENFLEVMLRIGVPALRGAGTEPEGETGD